jgi:hypothetical protein
MSTPKLSWPADRRLFRRRRQPARGLSLLVVALATAVLVVGLGGLP